MATGYCCWSCGHYHQLHLVLRGVRRGGSSEAAVQRGTISRSVLPGTTAVLTAPGTTPMFTAPGITLTAAGTLPMLTAPGIMPMLLCNETLIAGSWGPSPGLEYLYSRTIGDCHTVSPAEPAIVDAHSPRPRAHPGTVPLKNCLRCSVRHTVRPGDSPSDLHPLASNSPHRLALRLHRQPSIALHSSRYNCGEAPSIDSVGSRRA